jgi:hypothetical protein
MDGRISWILQKMQRLNHQWSSSLLNMFDLVSLAFKPETFAIKCEMFFDHWNSKRA